METQTLSFTDYELIDCGEGRRLERFANCIVDRPAPQATWPKKLAQKHWQLADAYYLRETNGQHQWSEYSAFPDPWIIKVGNFSLALKATMNNQIGIFPEQFSNWSWLTYKLQKYSAINKPTPDNPIKVLNAFAYTGAATLAAASAIDNIEVCHIDAAKTSVNFARNNAKLSGLENKPIRWIVDDVLKFIKRELKRDNRYHGIILDPPAFGRGSGSSTSWKIKRDLPLLLDGINQLLTDNPCFVILSCHAPNLTSKELAKMIEKLSVFSGKKAKAIDLVLRSNPGNDLPSSICARI